MKMAAEAAAARPGEGSPGWRRVVACGGGGGSGDDGGWRREAAAPRDALEEVHRIPPAVAPEGKGSGEATGPPRSAVARTGRECKMVQGGKASGRRWACGRGDGEDTGYRRVMEECAGGRGGKD